MAFERILFVCNTLSAHEEKVLPFGAYCSFTRHKSLADCGWINVVTNRTHGSPDPPPSWELREVTNELTATAVFNPKSGLTDRAVMRTIDTFSPIPRFHSLSDSKFYNSCSVSWKELFPFLPILFYLFCSILIRSIYSILFCSIYFIF